MANRSISQSVEVPADAQTVYAYLTEAQKLEKWFPSKAETDPKEGGRYRFTFMRSDGTADHEREGTFRQLAPGKRVEYDWSFGAGETTVRFDLSRNGSGTQVGLEHSGFGEGPDWKEAYEMHDAGWKMFMDNLRSCIEGGKDLRKEMGFA